MTEKTIKLTEEQRGLLDRCRPCSIARNKWMDSRPSQVLPSFGFTHGSGVVYDTTPAAIRSRASDRYERWRQLVKTSIAQINTNCLAGRHAPDSKDDEE